MLMTCDDSDVKDRAFIVMSSIMQRDEQAVKMAATDVNFLKLLLETLNVCI